MRKERMTWVRILLAACAAFLGTVAAWLAWESVQPDPLGLDVVGQTNVGERYLPPEK